MWPLATIPQTPHMQEIFILQIQKRVQILLIYLVSTERRHEWYA